MEFHNSLELSRVPSHKLRLKVGVPVLLMRNIDRRRLCNGTRIQITHMERNIIRAKIIPNIFAAEVTSSNYFINGKVTLFACNVFTLNKSLKQWILEKDIGYLNH